jgi:hypothetical protein
MSCRLAGRIGQQHARDVDQVFDRQPDTGA